MGLDAFPLLQNHICLVTYNNTVFKLKLEYQQITQQKREAFAHVVTEQTAHCQIEDVCRAVLYNIERKEELSPVQTDNFIIYPEVCKWPLSKSMHFFVNGKKLSCHPNLILFKLFCKDVAVTDPEQLQANVLTYNKNCKLARDSQEMRAASNSLAKTTDSTLCPGGTVIGNKNAEIDQSKNNNAIPYIPGLDQVRGGQSPKNNTKKVKVNIGLSVGPCSEMSDSDSDKISDREASESINSICLTESQFQKRHFLRNTFMCEGLVENEREQVTYQSKRTKIHKTCGSSSTNQSSALKYKGSLKAAIDSYKRNTHSKIHAKSEKDKGLLNKSKNNQDSFDITKKCSVSLEMLDRNIVEISDDGSIVYDSEKMTDLDDVTSVTPVKTRKLHNKNMKNPFSPEKMDRLQKSRYASQSLESRYINKHNQIKSVERRTDQNHIRNSGTSARKQERSRQAHGAHSLGDISFSKEQTHAVSHSKKGANVNKIDSHDNIAQNTRGKLSTLASNYSRRATRSLSVTPSSQDTKWSSKTLHSRRRSQSQSPKLRKRTNRDPDTLEATQEFFEAKQHLLESKDGVWLFWKSSRISSP